MGSHNRRREGCKGLKKMHLEAPPDTQRGRQEFCPRIPPSPCKPFPTLHGRVAAGRYYFSRKRRIRRSTEEYIAVVTRPVCVFCWLG